jgi:hypothetical protein
MPISILKYANILLTVSADPVFDSIKSWGMMATDSK